MSDPAKSSDIEDVLASIRSLVAEDSAEAKKPGGSADRLLLKSEYRVGAVDKGDADGPLVLTNKVGDEGGSVTGLDEETSPKSATSDLSSATGKGSNEGRADRDGPVDAHPQDHVPDGDEDRIADRVLAATRGAREAPGSDGVSENRRQRTSADEDATGKAHTGRRDNGGQSVNSDGFEFRKPNDVEETASKDPGEPTDAGSEDAASALAERRTGMQVAVGKSDAAVPATPSDPVLDEAAIRALVSEIVRSELQGSLGERITRNVRKLVRREIMRALSVRDEN